MAANQVGKTLGAGNELSYHTRAEYPDWWEGRVFHGPTKWWASNTNNETVRDNPQRILLGEGTNYGTGTLPSESIDDVIMARGFPNLVDRIIIKCRGGGKSQIQFKAYDQGRKKWQGETLNGGIWFDEEPPMDIYSEGMARLAPGAISFITATPLLGMSDVVMLFYPHPKNPRRALVMMSLDDASHYTAAEKEERSSSYAPHELEARTKGLPMLGSGRVYPITQEQIEEEALSSIPSFWPQLVGIDFGYEHPFAAVCVAWDRDADVIHVHKAYRQQHAEPPLHAAAIKPWGDWIRVAWPHDGSGLQKDGQKLAELYRREKLKMLDAKILRERSMYFVEPGIEEVRTRMQTGRLKVAKHLSEWFAEFQAYHRKDGKIVKERDDLMDATRLAVTAISLARTNQRPVQAHTVGMDYEPLSAA